MVANPITACADSPLPVDSEKSSGAADSRARFGYSHRRDRQQMHVDRLERCGEWGRRTVLKIEGAEIAVWLLDPNHDRDRLGSRYCCGGYIYQVFDARQRPLLAGPQWPAPRPDVFHGQGAPEAFNRYPDAEHVAAGGPVGVIGVGEVRRSASDGVFDPRHDREVLYFLDWVVSREEGGLLFAVDHRFGARRYALEKSVSLEGRTVRSSTRIENLAPEALPVRWFAHPFFPIPDTEALFRTHMSLEIPENPGFYRNERGWVCRRSDHRWKQGCFVRPELRAAGPLVLEQAHPVVGSVTVSTDFTPSAMPIWGNENTFSMEPYLEESLEPGASLSWSVCYRFGPA
jgi:hypothetical protein